MMSYWKHPESMLKDNSDCINQVQYHGKSNETTSAITAVGQSCGICIFSQLRPTQECERGYYQETMGKSKWMGSNGWLLQVAMNIQGDSML